MNNKLLSLANHVINNQYVLLGTRLILGTTFILAGAGKLPEMARFVDVVTGWGLLPWGLAQVYGTILPWLELIVGIFLVLGLLPRLAAGVIILMVISFIVANGTAVVGHEFSECACFGGLILIKKTDALAIDIAIISMAILLLFKGSGLLSFGYLIRRYLNRCRLKTSQH
ncbi:DoxX family protein [Chloroflexota bacterium]